MFTSFAIDPASFDIFLKLAVAIVCGALIGTERVISHKSAGMRTYALVSMGAALFVIISDIIVKRYVGAGFTVNDPLHMTSMIISGIGFMGAGMIIFRNDGVTGLTSASGFWVAAGIGMASGYGLFSLAWMTTLLTLFVFIVLWHVEKRVKKFSVYSSDENIQKE